MDTKIFLTKDEVLTLNDIEVKGITVPYNIPGWGGRSLYIKQLTRGQQDRYLKRQYGDTKMRQDRKAKNQEITAFSIYGHDAWLCLQGICDAQGKPMFTDADLPKLEARNGEAIGWIASEIVKFSGMDAEAKAARGEVSEEEVVSEDVKN
ncbi:MAG: hypothetical protein HYZ24_10855 [Chloroflexi bacterium]|nr:hypothetical protein [Chloroflexota bacterium]